MQPPAPSGEDHAAKLAQVAPHESGGSEVHSAENSDSPSSSSSQMIPRESERDIRLWLFDSYSYLIIVILAFVFFTTINTIAHIITNVGRVARSNHFEVTLRVYKNKPPALPWHCSEAGKPDEVWSIGF